MNAPHLSGAPRMGKAKRVAVWIAGALGVAFIVIQFIPVAAMENPPERPPWPEPPEVVAIAKRACYDCHSNEVRWPWYSKLAPASWLVARDVIEGRKSLNVSEWPEDEEERQFERETIRDVIVDGSMPPWFYLPLHPEAKLTEQDIQVIEKWVEAGAAAVEAAEEAEEEEEREETEEEDGETVTDREAVAEDQAD